MNTKEIIKNFEGNGGLDMRHIEYVCRKENIAKINYLMDMVIGSFNCSRYVAKRAALHYLKFPEY